MRCPMDVHVFRATKRKQKHPRRSGRISHLAPNLKTDTIDVYQFQNPHFARSRGTGSGLYKRCSRQRRRENPVYRLTNHRLHIAREAENPACMTPCSFR
jgi:hypothetical protein